MNNEINIFNFEDQQVRTLEVDGEPYFVGKDIAEILGYADPRRAVIQHVDKEDRKSLGRKDWGDLCPSLWDNPSDFTNKAVVNESGVYSLIFDSRMPSAKKFKHWVTKEVLPAIRATGSYQVPKTPEEQLALTMKATVHLTQRMDKAEKDIDEIKNKSEIDSAQRYKLEMTRKQHVIEIVGGKSSNFYKQKKTRKVFSALFHDLADEFMVSRYADITKEQFNDAMKFIRDWYPPYPLKQEIDTINAQTSFDI